MADIPIVYVKEANFPTGKTTIVLDQETLDKIANDALEQIDDLPAQIRLFSEEIKKMHQRGEVLRHRHFPAWDSQLHHIVGKHHDYPDYVMHVVTEYIEENY